VSSSADPRQEQHAGQEEQEQEQHAGQEKVILLLPAAPGSCRFGTVLQFMRLQL